MRRSRPNGRLERQMLILYHGRLFVYETDYSETSEFSGGSTGRRKSRSHKHSPGQERNIERSKTRMEDASAWRFVDGNVGRWLPARGLLRPHRTKRGRTGSRQPHRDGPFAAVRSPGCEPRRRQRGINSKALERRHDATRHHRNFGMAPCSLRAPYRRRYCSLVNWLHRSYVPFGRRCSIGMRSDLRGGGHASGDGVLGLAEAAPPRWVNPAIPGGGPRR